MAEKKKELYKNIGTASISSVIARTVICPIERVEIFRQLSNSEFFKCSLTQSIRLIIQKQGLSGLLKGNSASLFRTVPFSCIEFYSMEFFKNIFLNDQPSKKDSNFGMLLICGTLTGLSAITFTYPMDVVRTRMASNTKDQFLKQTKFSVTLFDLYKKGGIRSLYRGYYITFIGSVPYTAIRQTTYEHLKAIVRPAKHQNLYNFLFGSLGGLIGTTILYPCYMIKRILQASRKINN